MSAYLVHLTRNYEGSDARTNLLNIIAERTVEARNPFGIALHRLTKHKCNVADALATQKVACFSETPLEDLSGLIDPGVWRKYQFRPYELVWKREYMLLAGANPVWYTNSYSAPGKDFPWLAHSINDLIREVCVNPDTGDPSPDRFTASEIAKLTPLIETMGSWPSYLGTGRRKTKDFSFEREWRHVGHFRFSLKKVQAIITPEDDEEAFRAELLKNIDQNRISGVGWRNLDEDEVIG